MTALGHAALKVETEHALVLVDPWFSPEGAFQASWFPFPDNSHLLQDAGLRSPTAVVISHEHLDHVDPWFLARVPPEVPVVVPRYPSAVLRDKILSGGPREIVEAAPWQTVRLANGTSVFFVSEASPMNHDSAIVLQGDGRTILDLNDARLSSVQLRSIRQRVGGIVDVFAFQGAGASWYPMCYGYPEGVERRLSLQKRMAKLRYASRSIEVLEPVVVLPFAGPPAFLDPQLFRYNAQMEGGIFPDQEQVAEWLLEQDLPSVVLLPGDVWDVDSCRRERDQTWDGFSFADRWPYLEAYAARRAPDVAAVLARHPQPTGSLWEPFHDHFSRLLSMSEYFNHRIGMRVGFQVTGPGGGDWAVDFRPGHEAVEADAGDCAYTYRFESRWLPSILEGVVPWEDFFLSLRFSAWRDPDQYNDHLLGLLKFADGKALKRVEDFEVALEFDERIQIDADGRIYSVSRYCPHAGNDLLETGEVLPGGILRCLGHHYEFDLQTGRCVNGMTSPLDVELVEC